MIVSHRSVDKINQKCLLGDVYISVGLSKSDIWGDWAL